MGYTSAAEDRSGQAAGRILAAVSTALIGAGIASAATYVPPPTPTAEATPEASTVAIRLTADSVANIPANLAQTIANMAAYEYQGVNLTTAALEDSGNWWLYIPTNVVGFDEQDKEKLKGMTLMMVPIPLVAQANYDQWWLSLAAFAPMTPDCTGIPGPCSDVFYFTQYGQVPTWRLVLGYTFPTTRNTIDPTDQTYTTADGRVVDIQPDWSGKTYRLEPFGPWKAIWQTLTQTPTGYVAAPSGSQWATALTALGAATWESLDPMVPGTYCLPCQIGGAAIGAPDSLPKIYLFGRYYTLFDFGQPLTAHDWVTNRPDYDEATRPDHAVTYNIWTKQSQQQIGADLAAATTPQALRASVAQFDATLQAVRAQLGENIAANIKGLEQALPVAAGSGRQLLDSIADSFAPQPPARAAATQVTVSADRALHGTGAPTTPARAAARPSAVPTRAASDPATIPGQVAADLARGTPAAAVTTVVDGVRAALRPPATPGGAGGRHRMPEPVARPAHAVGA